MKLVFSDLNFDLDVAQFFRPLVLNDFLNLVKLGLANYGIEGAHVTRFCHHRKESSKVKCL
jgi:hypothetical protein